ncbi:MAG: hypothetical protein Q7T20_02330 [Saprospiraceae bacterium]|nr:hypothetical protein [Saprospiraceae bacterium]
MTQERFTQIVDDPDLLRRITYEELKTLALAYPYAHNLRCLLAIKARQIDHPDATRNLATAAAYSLDRTRLFLLVAPQVIVPQQVLAPEEVLELKPIETVKRELEALSPLAREERSFELPMASEANLPAEPPAPLPVYEEKFVAESVPPEPLETAPEPPTPVVRQAFSEWISHFQPPVLEQQPKPTRRIMPTSTIAEKIEESAKTPGIAQQLAERSVAENQDVISETLAKLYAKQGYRDKSAQMYARLALLFPEKSAYFAAEIDKLKK